jgi:hypothetical protein
MYKFRSALIGICMVACQNTQQDTTQPTFSKVALHADMQALSDELKTHHAGLFQYITPPEFANLWTELPDTLNILPVYQWFARKITAIQCGHTQVNLPRDIEKRLKEDALLLPFQVRIIEAKIHIAQNHSKDKRLTPGTEIIAINQKPVAEILQAITQHISADAGNIHFKIRKAEKYFAWYYHLFSGDSEQDFEVDFRSVGSPRIQSARLEGINYQTWTQYRRTQTKPSLKYEAITHLSTAILTIQSFDNTALQSPKSAFKHFLENTFTEIKRKNLQNLLIDLRGNGGGDIENGIFLLQYLMQKPFRLYQSVQSNAIINPTKSSPVVPELSLQTPNLTAFAGKIFVLTNGATFSVAADVCAVLRSSQRAVLVGEKCGGAYRGNTGGIIASFTLPHSQMVVQIPRRLHHNAVDKSLSLFPDFPVVPTAWDLQSGVDVEKRVVIELISQESEIK